MRLEPQQLSIIREEALALAKEASVLPPARREQRLRFLAITLTEAELLEEAEAARSCAIRFAAGETELAHLVELLSRPS